MQQHPRAAHEAWRTAAAGIACECLQNTSASPADKSTRAASLHLQPVSLEHSMLRRSSASRQDAQTGTFESSTALMDNAWRDFERRGVKVTAEREPGWRWWQPGADPMQVRVTSCVTNRGRRQLSCFGVAVLQRRQGAIKQGWVPGSVRFAAGAVCCSRDASC